METRFNNQQNNQQTTTFFVNDKKNGSISERIFEEDFLKQLCISYTCTTKIQEYKNQDIDFITDGSSFEIKGSYNEDRKELIIEIMTNCDENLGTKKQGWGYNCKAQNIVFISKNTRKMIFLKFDIEFKKWYNENRKKYVIEQNIVSEGENGAKWKSTFRRIPVNDLQEFISIYQKK